MCCPCEPLAMPVFTAYRLTLLAAACAALSACSSFNNVTGRVGNLVSPYKVDVVQGNFVSKEQKDALQIGMPRAQVRDILGAPLVSSVFHADRWDYVFTFQRQGQEPQQRKLTVYFKGDELNKVDSDELISEQEFVSSLSVGRRFGKVPLLEVPPEVLREFGLPSAAAASSSAAVSAATTAAATRYPPLEAPGAVTSAWDASTQRAVAASVASRSAAAAATSAAPLLPAPAPAPAPATTASPAASVAAPVRPVSAAPTPALQAQPAAVAIASAPAAPRPVPPPAPAPAPAAIAPSTAPAVAPANAAVVSASVAPAAAPPAARPAVTTPAPAAAAVAASAPPVSSVSVAAAPPPVVVSAPSASTLASADPEITTLLNRWTTDWQSRNAAAYFSHYVAEFKGTSATRAEWETLRRSRIEGRSRISLSALDVRVRMVSPNEARLVFRQVYESEAFTEIGTKAMFLVKRDGRWLIEREFFTPAQ